MRILLAILALMITLYAKSYNELKFEGLVRLSDLSVIELIGFGANEDVDHERINKAIHTLFDQGYFVDIVVDEPEDGVLRFAFKEKPSISSIEFKGVSETEREEKIKPVFGVKKGETYDKRKIEAAKKRLVDMVRAEGYYDTLVDIESEFKDEKVLLTVSIRKGSNITITKNSFEGLKAFDKKEVQKDIANKERQSFSWFFGRSSGKLKLLDLPYDSDRLNEFYLKHGYLDIEVSEPFLKADFDTYQATIDYKLTEGEPYSVSSIDIVVLDKDDNNLTGLIDELKLKPMRRFNVTKMRADIERIREEVASEGYAFARVVPDIKKDTTNHTASITYRVTYGNLVYIRDVIISGNNRTLDRVIRREIFLAPHDLYSLRDLKDSKSALMRLGYFESATIDEKRITDSSMDLVITVKETATGNLMIGGGYSSYDGFILNASINDRNMLGSGYAYSLELDTSKRTKRYELSLTNPRVKDSPYSLTGSVYYTHYEATTYTRDSQGLGLSVGRRLGRHWRASIGSYYSFNDNTYEEPDQFYVDGKTTKLSLTPSASFDNTDDYFNPRSGHTFSQSLEVAGFGEDEEYFKSTTSFGYFKGFEDDIEYDLIFRFRARLQAMHADIDDIKKFPLGSRLYLGGTRSIRGYQNASIAPVRYDTNGDVLTDRYGDVQYMGGKLAYNQSVEFSIPLIEEAKMRMAFFYDYGAIGIDDFAEKRSSYGMALEWISPMGPLQFIWAWPLDKKDYDTTSNFEFTLGQRF